MRFSTHPLCACRGPDGKPLGKDCPQLRRKDGSWNSRHGSMGWAARIPTTSGIKQVKRYGYDSKKDAEADAGHAGKLLDLAADDLTRARIGDMIAAVKRGAPLPAIEDVQRRLGLGLDPGQPGATTGAAWAAWLAGKKRLRPSSRARLEEIGRHWLLPVLDGVPLERLNGAHVSAVFDRIGRINAGIAAAQADGSRSYVRVEDDVRTRPRPVGTAAQHRVYAALREFCNFEMRKTRRLAYNPVYAVELEPEVTPEARRWSAAQARTFLDHAAGDPLGLLFRIIVLRGARRAEAAGFRWAGADLDAGYLTVARTLLLVGSEVIEGRPKSGAGERRIWLDAETVRLLREHRAAQLRARMKAGPAWTDSDLVFCRDDGTPYRPDYLSRRFKALAVGAGVPVIKLHEGRHSAASLARDAEVDPEIRRRTLGHADQAMTSHYTHIEAQAHRAAAEAVATLVEGAGS
jgi:integrase